MPNDEPPSSKSAAGDGPAPARGGLVVPPAPGDPRAGARLMSFVVCPGTTSEDERTRYDVECAIGFEAARVAASRNVGLQSLRMPPDYFRQSDNKRQQILRRVQIQLGRQLEAAAAIRPLLYDVIRVKQGQAKIHHSLAACLTDYLDRNQARGPSGQPVAREVANFRRRILQPSYPVLHIATVLGLSLALVGRAQRGRRFTFEDVVQALRSGADFGPSAAGLINYGLLLQPEIVEVLIDGSQVVAQLIAESPELQAAAGQLIDLSRSNIRRIPEPAPAVAFRDVPGHENPHAKTPDPSASAAAVCAARTVRRSARSARPVQPHTALQSASALRVTPTKNS